ncbi:methyltransferase type 12 [Candidatus Moduliflexus flocculans]|uniref:Methyltransferase type 12 n=1 Tax=Candidatus Moduliflexus flocculans TaxID=1499966 RepID=A0A081BRG7_9BACT|nr:methyltransferase type 12 [Candidatus Moduliflexus flocculans]
MNTQKMTAQTGQTQWLQQYYRLHSKIYDATRWTFLFGRNEIITEIHNARAPARILEIGCGTGKNLARMARLFPQAELTGIDLADAMLKVARKKFAAMPQRVTFVSKPYEQPLAPDNPFDLILCSYSLSMMNPGWEGVIDCAARDLAPGGLMAVVDFHDSPFRAYKKWMALNHVRLDAHLLPKLTERFQPVTQKICPAYRGLWTYFLFLGERRA